MPSKEEERAWIEGILETVLDGGKVALDAHLLVENVHDARTLLHEASVLLIECARGMPASLVAPMTVVADVLHRVSCEKTAEGTEEPQTWSNESPFLN